MPPSNDPSALCLTDTGTGRGRIAVMPVRTGAQYIQGLRDRPPQVWLGGERVPDVTEHPGLRNGVLSLAALYDMQSEAPLVDQMTYSSPDTGDRVGLSFITPLSSGDLERRRGMMHRWAAATAGMMARTPDYLNVTIMAMASAGNYFGQNRPEFEDNIRRYYQLIREQDLVLTHSLLNPQRRRTTSRRVAETVDEEAALRLLRKTDIGIVVRGCRILATLGPISDELAVYPIRPQDPVPNAEQFAMAFAIPCDTPGLKFLCRESFDHGRTNSDHPLGSRFEEMDALVFFDDVLVPWERVFLLEDVELCNGLARNTNFLAQSDHQVVTRQVAKSAFLLGVASLMVDALSSGEQAHVQERLGEIIMYLEVMKACLRAGEVDAATDQWGVTTPAATPLAVARNLYARTFYPRITEIIQLLGSSSLMALPSEADFETELGPEMERYLATDTASAMDRNRLFHLAWDISCSAFGARQTHYERHFAGDPVRSALILANAYDRKPAEELVRRFLLE